MTTAPRAGKRSRQQRVERLEARSRRVRAAYGPIDGFLDQLGVCEACVPTLKPYDGDAACGESVSNPNALRHHRARVRTGRRRDTHDALTEVGVAPINPDEKARFSDN
jgi:hypothetical protein